MAEEIVKAVPSLSGGKGPGNERLMKLTFVRSLDEGERGDAPLFGGIFLGMFELLNEQIAVSDQ